MNRSFWPLLAAAAAIFMLQSCSSFPQKQEMRSHARVYDETYERVWEAAVDVLRGDLNCIFKKNDKSGGVLETEWAHRMDTEGRKRWMVTAEIRTVKQGVEVTFYKKLEMQDEVSKSIDKYSKNKKDSNEAASGGWRKSDIDMTSVDQMYRLLEKRLAIAQ